MISGIVSALLPSAGKVIDRLVPDKNAAAKAKQELEAEMIKAATKANLAQLEINKVEAGHRSIFVAGWRPFIGWTCGVAMAWHFVGVPITLFVAAWIGADIPELPQFDMESLMTVLLGMLGLGGLRTYEKKQGVSK